MKRWLRPVLFLLALAFFAYTFVNASWLATPPAGNAGLIAHRADPPYGSCEAAPGEARYPVLPDNTLPAVTTMRQLGASMIAVEIAPDGSLAPAECPEGYGGKPTLAQLARVADPKSLLFTFTGSDPAAADALAAELKKIGRDPGKSRDAFYATAEEGPVARMREIAPDAWIFSAESARACTEAYRVRGWFGITPDACKGGTMAIPIDRQGTLAGWPNRLLARMDAADTHVIVTGPESGGGLRGIDLPEQFGEIPDSFTGHILVDDIWNLAPALFPRVDNRTNAEKTAGDLAVKQRRAASD